MSHTGRRWNVWSKDPSRDIWMVVEPNVSEWEAKEGAARRTRTAAKVGLEVAFLALPHDENPHSATSGKTADKRK